MLGCAAGAGGGAGSTAEAGGGGLAAVMDGLVIGFATASGFATGAAGPVEAFAAAAGAGAVGGAAAGGAAGDGGADEIGAGDAVAGGAGAWGCAEPVWVAAGPALTADRTGCLADGPAEAGAFAGLDVEFAGACGCDGCAAVCCSLGGEACNDRGSGSLAYFACSVLAAAISLPPSIFCSLICLRQASMTGSVALRQRATASGNSVTIKSPRSTTILATAAAC